jgi:hypothetical protein
MELFARDQYLRHRLIGAKHKVSAENSPPAPISGRYPVNPTWQKQGPAFREPDRHGFPWWLRSA